MAMVLFVVLFVSFSFSQPFPTDLENLKNTFPAFSVAYDKI